MVLVRRTRTSNPIETFMNTSNTEAISDVPTSKNGEIEHNGGCQNLAEEIVNGVSSKNAETSSSIPEETSEKKIRDAKCGWGKSVAGAFNDDKFEDLLDIRIPSNVILLEGTDNSEVLLENRQSTTTVFQKPAENLKVDDRAILDCWELTLASHDAAAMPRSLQPPSTLEENKYRWIAKDMISSCSTTTAAATDESVGFKMLTKWQPDVLNLPLWAVDPFEMSSVIDGTKTNQEEIEQHEK